MIRQKEGHIVYQPLESLFTMSELFGSMSQEYDAETGEYTPDRTLTPFTLLPNYSVTDNTGGVPTGGFTSALSNVIWTVTARVNGSNPVLNTHYTIDSNSHALTLNFNLDPDTIGSVRFTADYLDRRRNEVLKLVWEKQLSCHSSTGHRIELFTEWPGRTNLFPWKSRGVFSIPVQLRNGGSDIADADAVYLWQVCENNTWRNVDPSEDIWCRSGNNNTKTISIDQAYVQKLLVRCEAWPADLPSKLQVVAFLVRRYYGQYDDDIDVLEGAYIFPATTRAVGEAYVTNRKGGRIPNPQLYFDIEVLYSRGDYNWWHIAHGTRGEVPRSMFPVDNTMQHLFGESTRELTALRPITVDGKILTVDGKLLCGQFPTIERDLED